MLDCPNKISNSACGVVSIVQPMLYLHPPCMSSSVVEVRARSLPGIVQKVEMDKVKLIAGQG